MVHISHPFSTRTVIRAHAHPSTRTNGYPLIILTIVALFVLKAPPAQAQQITIDTRQQSEPISPYIYGQFIEHLGRCIYGGIWAEMLEDRKFFYPVTGYAQAWELYHPGESSWQGVGDP